MTIRRMIDKLIKEDQPFILIKGTSSLLTNYSAYFELVIWQTIEKTNNSMCMSRDLFREMIRTYNLKLLQKNDEGEIYGLNHRLRELRELWRKEYSILDKERKQAQAAFIKSGGKNQDIKTRHSMAVKAVNTFNSSFKKKHNIKSIRYNEGGRKGGNNDE